MKLYYKVTGMSCSACSSKVEHCVSLLDNISDVSVNFLTGKMTVEINNETDSDKIKQIITSEVASAGYHAELLDSENTLFDTSFTKTETDSKGTFKELNKNLRKLILSIIILIILAYITMGQMLGLPVPYFASSSINPVSFSLIQMTLTICIIGLNKKYYINGFRNLFRLSPSMDTLISLGSTISFIYSLVISAIIIRLNNSGDYIAAAENAKNLFYESAAMIPVFISIGKYLEENARNKTSDSLKGLIKLKPEKAVKYNPDTHEEAEIPINEIIIGDILCVHQGEGIPCDGEIIYGNGGIDESMLTGESIPIDKKEGDKVFEATINKQGYFRMKAEKTGKETVFSQIIALVEDASGSKAPIQRLADRISMYFVPIVLIIAIITFVSWLIAGYDLSFAISMGVSVMVISCPCSLGLATPTAIMAGTGRGAEMKILIKSAEALETLHKCDTIFFDKTGTITTGELVVSDIINSEDIDRQSFIQFAAKFEGMSSHPISAAIASLSLQNNNHKEVQNLLADEIPLGFTEKTGMGLVLETGKFTYLAGNIKLLNDYSENGKISDVYEKCEEYGRLGKTTVIFARKDKTKASLKVLGFITVTDKIKPDAENAIKCLNDLRINTVMLTGDNQRVAENIASQSGIESFYSEMSPEQKLEKIKEAMENGHCVAMVGDGINDAPALLTADVGIAIGTGTDVAIDSADIVLLGNNLSTVTNAFRLSKATIKNIKQNLFWALFYNCISIPIAAGVFFPFFGIKLNPIIAAACMSLSSIFVVTNALRLRFFKKTI